MDDASLRGTRGSNAISEGGARSHMAGAAHEAAVETSRWSRGAHRLHYQLGEISLFHASFDAWIADGHLGPSGVAPAGLTPPLPPFAALPEGTDLALVRSYPTSGELPRVTRDARFLRYVLGPFPHHLISLEGTFADYLANLRSRARHEMLRKVRKAGARAKLHVHRTPAELATFLPIARELSATTYQEKLLRRGFPQTPEFAEDVARRAAEDRARGYVLCDENEPIAYGYCRIDGLHVFFDFTGFDPRAEALSPGIVLFHGMLASLFDEGRFALLDLGMGDSQMKRTYATHSLRCVHVMYLPPTLRSHALVHSHRLLGATARAAARALERAGVKDHARRLLRRTA